MKTLSCNSTACLHRGVLRSLAKDERWSPGWAYDGQKSMYAPDLFLPQAETSYNVRCSCCLLSLCCAFSSWSFAKSVMSDTDTSVLAGHGRGSGVPADRPIPSFFCFSLHD